MNRLSSQTERAITLCWALCSCWWMKQWWAGPPRKPWVHRQERDCPLHHLHFYHTRATYDKAARTRGHSEQLPLSSGETWWFGIQFAWAFLLLLLLLHSYPAGMWVQRCRGAVKLVATGTQLVASHPNELSERVCVCVGHSFFLFVIC